GLGPRESRFWQGKSGPVSREKPKARRLLALGAVGLLLVLTLIPLPFKLKADGLVVPVATRFVSVRFDGILKEVHTQPGDRVAADTVLARLDGRDLDLELARLRAERSKSLKLRDQYMAAGSTAETQIALLDAQRYAEQIKLLQEKQRNLELVSPVAGILISGDQRRREGGPVSRGEVLFEVAPVERMEVELAIGEADIGYAREDLPVEIRFSAYPDLRWRGALERITPRSQLRDNRNVFVARLSLDNGDGRLRPGMRGEARIRAGKRPLAWQLFRKPWHTLLRLSDRLF
ncbi:MAG: efflux RND transporter periplasmic adaptor subunit, partial [Desulfobacterales bacterium]